MGSEKICFHKILLNGILIQPTSQNTATYKSPTFSVNGSGYSFRNSTLTGMIVGGEYNVGIYNGGSGYLTINNTLGINIKTFH